MEAPYQYLFIYKGQASYTHWFDAENNFSEGMVVFDLHKGLFTTDGVNWNYIEEDHL